MWKTIILLLAYLIVTPVLGGLAGWNMSKWGRKHGKEFQNNWNQIKEGVFEAFYIDKLANWLADRIS